MGMIFNFIFRNIVSNEAECFWIIVGLIIWDKRLKFSRSEGHFFQLYLSQFSKLILNSSHLFLFGHGIFATD